MELKKLNNSIVECLAAICPHNKGGYCEMAVIYLNRKGKCSRLIKLKNNELI